MQINKISLNNINSANNIKQNNYTHSNLSFEGDSFKKGKPKTEYVSYPHNFVIDIQGKIVTSEAKKIQAKGLKFAEKAEGVMLTSGINFSAATSQFKLANNVLNEIEESGKGIIYHNNGEIKAIMNNGIITEFDDNGDFLRESLIEDDEVAEVNYVENGTNERATKTQNGIKLEENVRYVKGNIKVADRVFNFNDSGDITTYQEECMSKSGKNSLQQAETQFNYKRNLLDEVLFNVCKKNNQTTSELRILYSSDRDITEAEKDVVFIDGRMVSTSERYVFSKRPEDNSILKSFDKFLDDAMRTKGKRRHIEYGANNKVLYSSKY